jgi:hypothetical protein
MGVKGERGGDGDEVGDGREVGMMRGGNGFVVTLGMDGME